MELINIWADYVVTAFKDRKMLMARQINEYRNYSHLNPVNRTYHLFGIPTLTLTMFMSAYIGLHAQAIYWQIVGFTVTGLLVIISLLLLFFGGWRGIVAVLTLGPMLYGLTITEVLVRNIGWFMLGGAVVFFIIAVTGLILGKAADKEREKRAIRMVIFTFLVLVAGIAAFRIEQIVNLEVSSGKAALVLLFMGAYYHNAGHTFFEGKRAVFLKKPFQWRNVMQAIYGAPLLFAEMLIGIFVHRYPYRVIWKPSSELLR